MSLLTCLYVFIFIIIYKIAITTYVMTSHPLPVTSIQNNPHFVSTGTFNQHHTPFME